MVSTDRSMDPRRDFEAGSAAQRAVHVPAPSTSTAPPRVPEYHVPPSVKPVLNYSIQTGEEFALEFMRDRALSQKLNTSGAGDQNAARTSYMDLRTMLGASHTWPDVLVPMYSCLRLLRIRGRGSLLRENLLHAQVQTRSTHTSTRSVPRALSSGDGTGRGPSHSSEVPDTSPGGSRSFVALGAKLVIIFIKL